MISLPTIWFSLLLTYFGTYIGLIKKDIDGNKALTLPGVVITLIIILIVLIFNLLNSYLSNKTETDELTVLKNETSYYRQLNESVDFICAEKFNQLKRMIPNNLNTIIICPKIISNPENQLKRILEQIDKCLQVFLSSQNYEFTHKDFTVTLAYNFPKIDNLWDWVTGTNIKGGLTLEQLTDDQNQTTFNYLKNAKKPYYFDNSKEEAKNNGHYMFDVIDETISNVDDDNKQPVGSIFCYKYEIKKRSTVDVNAILSISTYRKRFVPDIYEKDNKNIKHNHQKTINNTRDNLIKIVEDEFGVRIGIELCLLYFDKLENIMVKNESEEESQ